MAWQTARYRDFTGGENRNSVPELIQPNQAAQLWNCVISTDGVPETRLGRTKINSTAMPNGALPIASVHRYCKEDGISKYLVVQQRENLYSASYSGSGTISSWTLIKTGLAYNVFNNMGTKLRSRVWRDKLILTNGIDAPFYFDGTSCTNLGGSPPTSSYIEVYGNRLWLVDVANPNQLRFSGLENYNTWDALDLIKIRDGDGDVITGIIAQPGGLIVTKNNSVWPLYGTSLDDIRVGEAISQHIGCVAPDTLLAEGAFLGNDNFYRFNLSSVTPAGDTHRSVISAMTPTDRRASFAVAIPKYQRGLVSLPNYGMLNLEGRYGCITSWITFGQSCFCVMDGKDDPGDLVYGDTSGNLYVLDNTTDDAGSSILTIIQSRDYGVESPLNKQWAVFQPEFQQLVATAGTATIGHIIDNASTTSETVSTSGTTIQNYGHYMHNAHGMRASFTFQHDKRVRLLGYTLKQRETGAI